jgi:GntR family transcriptional repressor for pyruvate dehydrogenase complex
MYQQLTLDIIPYNIKSMNTFKPIKKKIISKEVEHRLRQSILDGLYSPGDKLPSERELVEQFKVSRVTVREALKNLETNGLIAIKRGMNAGTYVSELKPDPIIENFKNLISLGKVNFAHLMHARLYIEPLAAKAAASIRTDKDITNLTALLDEAERYLNYSPRKARLLCTSFHCEIAKILQNPIIDFICESITENYSSVLIEMSKTKLDKNDIHNLINEHRYILDSIIQKELDEAYERTKNHLIKTYHMYSQMFPHKDNKSIENYIKLY